MNYPSGAVANKSISNTGIGLRHCHIDLVHETRPVVPWFEILADNHMDDGGPIKRKLLEIRQDYQFTMHCVGMSLGTAGLLDLNYLKKIRELAGQFEVQYISDHVCFTHLDTRHYHELLPLPYTGESLQHLVQQVQRAQDFLNTRILIENVSSYFTYSHSTIPEWEFITELATRADCYILLDLNNVHVNAFNHGFDASNYIKKIPLNRVKEIHLAGFEDCIEYLFDSHGDRVCDDVWRLFRDVMQRAPTIPALIEWDNDIPEFTILMDETRRADKIRQLNQPTSRQRKKYHEFV